MYLVTMALVATDRADLMDLEPTIVSDILWAVVRPEQRLEHVHAMAWHGRVDLALFHQGIDETEAAASALQMCEQACISSPMLRGWRPRQEV